MKKQQVQAKHYETITWGALIIWWGIVELIGSMHFGLSIIGVGVILLGVNAARVLSRRPINKFTTTLGGLIVIWGGLDLAGIYLQLPFEIPVFAILLISAGLIYLAIELIGNNNKYLEV